MKRLKIDGQIKTVDLICEIHGDYIGTSMQRDGKEINSICPVCAEEEEARERAIREAEIQRRQANAVINDAFKRSCIPVIFREISFDDYTPTCRDAEIVLNRLTSYVDKFSTIKSKGSSILITGNTGTGKTTLACAVLNSLTAKGVTTMYTTSYEIIRHIKSSWTRNPEYSQDDVIKKYRIPELLVIDEIGKGDGGKVNSDLLFEVVNERYYNGLPTIYISLYDVKKLGMMFEPDLIRRLSHRGASMQFNWARYEDKNAFPI